MGLISHICDITAFISCAGKNHVCKFTGCGRNDKFNYVVMQLQVQCFFICVFMHVCVCVCVCVKSESFFL